jgi:hypothetical protein
MVISPKMLLFRNGMSSLKQVIFKNKCSSGSRASTCMSDLFPIMNIKELFRAPDKPRKKETPRKRGPPFFWFYLMHEGKFKAKKGIFKRFDRFFLSSGRGVSVLSVDKPESAKKGFA